MLLALAAFTFWATRGLDAGTMRVMGPAALPRGLSVLIGALGIGMMLYGARAQGEALQPARLRGPVVIMLTIALFAVVLRPVTLFGVHIPGLGLIGAAPLAVLAAGFAEDERRWTDLVILALALTGFSILLFGYLLSLPIPAFPVSWIPAFQGLSYRTVLLVLGVAMVVVAGIIALIARRGTRA